MPMTKTTTKSTDQLVADTEAWLDQLDPAELEDATDLRRIGQALAAVKDAENELEAAVVAARTAGVSWTAIAVMFGVSRQAVTQRFGAAANSAT